MKLASFLPSTAIAAVFLFGAAGAFEAKADTIGFTAPGGLTTNVNPNVPVNLGNVFVANSTFTIDALGFYYQNSLTGPEQVALYDSSGHLLTSTTVNLTDPNVSGFLFHSITPFTLNAGSTYTLDVSVGNNPWAYGPAPTSSYVTFQYNDYVYGSGLIYPTLLGGSGPAYYGGNFEVMTAANPEPRGLVILLTLGLLTGFLYRKVRPAAEGTNGAGAN